MSFQAAEDLSAGEAFGGSACSVGARLGVVHESVVGDRPERAVALTVAAFVEPVSFRFAAGGFDRETPQRAAKAASERSRSGLSLAITSSLAAVSLQPASREAAERSLRGRVGPRRACWPLGRRSALPGGRRSAPPAWR